MNDMTVGMENLPNVFIDKIMIERNSIDQETVQYYTSVTLKMFDSKDNPSWRNKLDGLKVKCLFIDDERIESLNTGELSLYDIPTATINNTTVESCDEFQNGNTQNGYESFISIFEFNTLTPPENLSVYVACFIDGLEFGIPQFDKFYGPMAAERIFVGGIPNQESGYFYNPETNEEYGGPVHQHSSGYMEGSEHIDAAHAGLRYVSEDNFKMIVGAGIEAEPALEETAEEEPSPFNDTAPYDPSSPNQSVAPPSGFSSAAEYEAYLLSQTAQQPNFNLVGNPTTINNPTGY
jgi:hypothetical protein